MKLYRIAKTKYADDLNGTGGIYGPGRWHREGTQILYLAEYVSLAKLEVLTNTKTLPRDMSLVTIEVPETASIKIVNSKELPLRWKNTPYLEELANITERWLNDKTSWIMRVPSIHTPAEFNYLLNPLHPEHKTLEVINIQPITFDLRLK